MAFPNFHSSPGALSLSITNDAEIRNRSRERRASNFSIFADVGAGRLLLAKTKSKLANQYAGVDDTPLDVKEGRFWIRPQKPIGNNGSSFPVAELTSIKKLPYPVTKQVEKKEMKSPSLSGMLPSISHAWASVDNILFIWNTSASTPCCVQHQEADNISAVGFVNTHKPFVDDFKHVLVIASSSSVSLVGVTLSDMPDKVLKLKELEPYTLTNPSGVTFLTVVTARSGRIFFGGSDGHLYEAVVRPSFLRQTFRLICHTKPIVSLKRVVNLVVNLGAEPIMDLQLDEDRNILYSRSMSSTITVFDLGGGRGPPVKIAEAVVSANEKPSWTFGKRPKRPVAAMASISTAQSKTAHLLTVLEDGRQVYLTTEGRDSFTGQRSKRPRGLREIYGQEALTPGADDAGPETDVDSLVAALDLNANSPSKAPETAAKVPSPNPEYARALANFQFYQPEDSHSPQSPAAAPAPPSPATISPGGSEPQEPFPLPEIGELAYYCSGVLAMSHRSRDDSFLMVMATREDCRGRDTQGIRQEKIQFTFKGLPLAVAEVVPNHELVAGMDGGSRLERGVEHSAKRVWAQSVLSTQHTLPRRRVLTMTSQSLYEAAVNRPIDFLRILLERSRRSVYVQHFFTRYGRDEAAAMALLLACGIPEGSNPVTAKRAADIFEDVGLVGEPQNRSSQEEGLYVPSGSMAAISLCALRILEPVWKLPVLSPSDSAGKTVAVEKATDWVSSFTDNFWNEVGRQVTFLEQFLRKSQKESRGVYRNVPHMDIVDSFSVMANTSMAEMTAVEHHQLQSGLHGPYTANTLWVLEVKDIECIRRLLRRAGDAIYFFRVLKSNSAAFQGTLGKELFRQLSGLSFASLVCEQDGHFTIKRVLDVIAESGESMEDLSRLCEELKAYCTSYFNGSDESYHKGVLCLKKAIHLTTLKDAEPESVRVKTAELARLAFQHLAGVVDHITLPRLSAMFGQLGFYDVVVKLSFIAFSRIVDPAGGSAEQEAMAASSAKSVCYDVVAGLVSSLAVGYSCKDRSRDMGLVAERERVALTLAKIVDETNCVPFQYRVFSVLFDAGFRDVFLKLGTPTALMFLNTKTEAQFVLQSQ